MKALRYYGPGDLKLEEAVVPGLKSGEVMVRVQAAGICATDLKTFQRGHPKIQPGSVIGHEIAGVIMEVNQAPGWKIGDRVAVAPYAPCLQCPQCKHRNYTTCENLMEPGLDPGGFAEIVRVPKRIVDQDMVRLPAEIPISLGALTEPLACCIHGLEALYLSPLDTLLIIGDGTMGLLQAILARKAGVSKIILSGKIPERLSIARELADMVVDVSRQDLVSELQKVAPAGADKVMVSVGDTRVAESAVQYVAKGGILNIYAGMPKGTMLNVDPNRIHYDEIRLVGTFGFTPVHFHKAAEALMIHEHDINKIISGTVRLEEVTSALSAMAEYRGIKYLVEFPN
jgi:L-iditol 2-dehydrogenase